jgi:hypothetical protein
LKRTANTWKDYKKKRDIFEDLRIEFAMTELFNYGDKWLLRSSNAESYNLHINDGVQTDWNKKPRRRLLDI